MKNLSQHITESLTPKNSNVEISDEIFDKTIASHNPQTVGVFGVFAHNADYTVFPLDDDDKKHVSQVKLKANEYLFRFQTSKAILSKQKPLIKINLDKGLVYFLTELALEADVPDFDTRGIKIRYAKFKTDFVQ